MGAQPTKNYQAGTCPGAVFPAIPGKVHPATGGQTVQVQCPNPPKGVKPGQSFNFTATINGQNYSVTAPAGNQPGMPLAVNVPSNDHIVVSTLHCPPPGFKLLQSKNVIFGNTTLSFHGSSMIKGQNLMGEQAGPLMIDAQRQMTNQAAQLGCNAVLGVNYSVTNDSSGDRGHVKMVLVTATGTACVIGLDDSIAVEPSALSPTYASAPPPGY
eukprot:CAMPEP_0175131482 /NCGR_PEP_ID=MMETSP0087-20121206/6564_1 /TAXON_ID=136419 /ORGANISM="Unknown Unknown, Strain D1" /LENGTH=212 /DNA_ID=CAMNT_0016413771 /DNA_START=47 /DNA_END=685 /DNA_ORIENTATION=-